MGELAAFDEIEEIMKEIDLNENKTIDYTGNENSHYEI